MIKTKDNMALILGHLTVKYRGDNLGDVKQITREFPLDANGEPMPERFSQVYSTDHWNIESAVESGVVTQEQVESWITVTRAMSEWHIGKAKERKENFVNCGDLA